MTAPYYQDDLVTLYHGTCVPLPAHPELPIITEWLAADVLVTDPPYGMSYRGGAMYRNYRTRGRQDVTEVTGDTSTKVRDEALHLWGRKPAIVFGTWRVTRPENVAHRLIWWKRSSWAGLRTASWFSVDEEIYIIGSGWSGKPRQNVYATNELRGTEHGLSAKYGHPTPKPSVLMEQLIERCPPGTIADPFAGSGSTLVAAKMLGRKAIGVEIEEKYCEIAARRLLQDALPFEVTA